MASVQRRIAPAPFTSPPFLAHSVGAEGGWGDAAGSPHPQPLSRAAGEGGAGSWPRCSAESPLLRSPPPFLAHSVGAEGGWGDAAGSPHPQPLSRAAGEGGAGSWPR
jgi:hypothetical protein